MIIKIGGKEYETLAAEDIPYIVRIWCAEVSKEVLKENKSKIDSIFVFKRNLEVIMKIVKDCPFEKIDDIAQVITQGEVEDISLNKLTEILGLKKKSVTE
jgi:hypothetical protein